MDPVSVGLAYTCRWGLVEKNVRRYWNWKLAVFRAHIISLRMNLPREPILAEDRHLLNSYRKSCRGSFWTRPMSPANILLAIIAISRTWNFGVRHMIHGRSFRRVCAGSTEMSLHGSLQEIPLAGARSPDLMCALALYR